MIVSGFRAALDLETYPLSNLAWFTIRRCEHDQRRIVNEFFIGTLGALVRATATQGIDSSVDQRDVPLITLAPASRQRRIVNLA